MSIIPRTGVSLTKICGLYFFIPTREASINNVEIEPAGIIDIICWESFSKGKKREQICAVLVRVFDMKPDDAEDIVDKCTAKLLGKGYLVEHE